MNGVDPLALIYAGIQVWKLYKDDQAFDAQILALKAKGLDAAGILEELHQTVSRAASEARAAVDRMEPR